MYCGRPTKDDLELYTREVLGDATVLPVAKAESLFGPTLAVQVEGVGIGENFLVTVCGLGCSDDAFAGFNGLVGGC